MLSLLFTFALSLSSHASEAKICQNVRAAIAQTYDFSSLEATAKSEMDRVALTPVWERAAVLKQQIVTAAAAIDKNRADLKVAVEGENYVLAQDLKEKFATLTSDLAAMNKEYELNAAKFSKMAQLEGLTLNDTNYVEFTATIASEDLVPYAEQSGDWPASGNITGLSLEISSDGTIRKRVVVSDGTTHNARSVDLDRLTQDWLRRMGFEDCAFRRTKS